MADDKDVLGKADALLRRHVVAPPASGTDTAGVPVLTDLIDEPRAAAGDGQEAITQEVYARVMAQVEGRLAAELERRLVDQVHAAVGRSVEDLRSEVARAIAEAVAEAFARRPVK